MGGHIPNPPSIPSQPPPLSQPPPPYCPSSPLIHPAVIQQTSSDTSLPNHRPSYRSQSSRSSEDDNLLCNDDIPEVSLNIIIINCTIWPKERTVQLNKKLFEPMVRHMSLSKTLNQRVHDSC